MTTEPCADVRQGKPTDLWQVLATCLAIAAGLAVSRRGLADPPAPVTPAVRIHYNLQYRDGSQSCILDLALPEPPVPRRLPVIVVIHGGGWLEGDKSSFVVAEDHTPCDIRDFAALGFAAAAINYRLSGEAPFPAALYDCQCAIRWLRVHADQYGLDAEHIGAYGNSAGGHLALMLAMPGPAAGPEEPGGPWAGVSCRVQSAASDSGPLDLVVQAQQGAIQQAVRQFLGGPPEGPRELEYRRASPTSYLSAKIPPLLLMYGEVDEQVLVGTADRFVEALGRVGHTDISYLRLAAVGHCPHSMCRIEYLRPVVNEFFRRTLSAVQGK